MRRIFNIILGALAMTAVALLAAFLTMRLAIHGREVEVPNVVGLTVAEAKSLASNLGLNINLENHYYSTVTPAGRILSQYPAPGTKVRREWVMRVTESSGPQRVSVPNVVGQTEREASVQIRRLSLDLGTVAYIPAPGPAGMVLAQTPTPDAAGVDGPRISLLVSEPTPIVRARPVTTEDTANADPLEATADPATSAQVPEKSSATSDETKAVGDDTKIATPLTATPNQPDGYVMPNLIGLTLAVANGRLAVMGLRIASMETVPGPFRPVSPVATPGSSAGGTLKPITPPAPVTIPNTIVSQSPAIGHRVTKTDSIHVVLNR